VSIGRAIVREPDVLIMDEPISHLDAGLRAAMREELESQVRSLGVTTLYITHDQVESLAMADRIAVMNLGKIQQIGTPDEIYAKPRTEFVAGFIGEPPMNFAACELSRSEEGFRLSSESFRLALKDRYLENLTSYSGSPFVSVGIRPEDLEVTAGPEPNTAAAVVELVEPQGDRTVVMARLAGGEEFLVQASADFRPDAGQTVHLKFHVENMHIFDRDTGLNLLYQ
jgi:multiple sugar transport system ATP-binding protein